MSPEMVASVVLGGFLGGAILLMFDLSRQPVRCRWCPHCLREAQDEKVRRVEQAHGRYHRFAGGRAEDCHNPDCEGRR